MVNLLTKKSKCTSKRETNIKPLLGLAYGLQTCIFGAKLLDYPSFVLRHPTEALANRAKFAHHPRRQWQVLLILPAGRLIRPLHGSDRHSSLSRIMRWLSTIRTFSHVGGVYPRRECNDSIQRSSLVYPCVRLIR